MALSLCSYYFGHSKYYSYPYYIIYTFDSAAKKQKATVTQFTQQLVLKVTVSSFDFADVIYLLPDNHHTHRHTYTPTHSPYLPTYLPSTPQKTTHKEFGVTMSQSQIFKSCVPLELLLDLLERVCIRHHNKYYLFNLEAFKKGMFNTTITDFLEACKPHYHLSKQYFVTRKQTYNTFITVLRQICNQNNIVYTSRIKYDNATYNINYFIYL